MFLGDHRTRLDTGAVVETGQAGAEEPPGRRAVRGVVAGQAEAGPAWSIRATDDIRYRNPAPSVIRLIDIVTTRKTGPRGHHLSTERSEVPDV